MNVTDVKNLTHGARLHYTGPNARAASNPCRADIGSRGGVKRHVIEVRITGAVKTWKRDAGRVQVPYKFGMYESGYITEANCEHFHLATDCPLG